MIRMHRVFAVLLIAVLAVSMAAGSGLFVARAAPSTAPMSVDEGYIGIPTAEFRTDADGNGLFEALIVRVPIVINVSGRFYLNAWLNNTGAGNSTDRTFSPGTYLIDFALPGYRLRISRTDGPYDLTIVLYDPSTGFTASRAYRTAAYRWDTFQFLAELQGGLSEVAVDANGDGLYNYIDVRGLLNVTRPENYTLRGTLYPKGSGFAVGFAFNRTGWSPGLSQFFLRFSAESIPTYGVNGPYTVEIQLENEYFDVWQTETFDTAPYAASQFYHKPILIQGNLTDHGVDFDGNGLFEVLRIEIPVAVTVQGLYHIRGGLSDPYMGGSDIFATHDVVLSPADHNTTLDFDGLAMLNTPRGLNTNLDVYISEHETSYNIHASAVIGSYPQNVFDNPYADWVGGLRITTPDLNGDGLFDELRVTGTLKVKQAATFALHFDVFMGYGGYLQYVDQYTSITAETGLHEVQVSFPGWRILAGKSNGTYTFGASVRTQAYNLQWTSTQANFTYDEFSPALVVRGAILNRTVDTDGDGLANQFVVTLPLRIVSTGSYTFYAVAYNLSSYVSSYKNRYLEPGDVDLTFAFSGILLRSMGANISFYFSAYINWGYNSFYVLDLRTPDAIPDLSIFQTATMKSVTFAATSPPSNSCCGSILLANYSNALQLDVRLDAQGKATVTIPDLGYLGFAVMPANTFAYTWIGKIPAPLPSNVTFTATPTEFHFDELLDVDLGDWSSGHAWLNRTIRAGSEYRFWGDLTYNADGILQDYEIRNVFHFVSFGIPLGIVLKVDDTSVLVTSAGSDQAVGAGPVESGDPITMASPSSLVLPGGVATSHTLTVNLTGGYSYHTPSARLRMPLGWIVTDVKSAPGVNVSGLGTREIFLLVTENRSAPSDAVLTVKYAGLYGQISGRVLGSGGLPAAGIHVEALLTGTKVAETTTASDGRFLLTGLLLATYQIRIQGAAYSIVARSVFVGLDRVLDLGDILLHVVAASTASVLGRVQDNTGTVIGDASITILSDAGLSMAETRSATDGRFRFDGVAAGTHTVRIAAPGFVTFEVPVQVVRGQTTDLEDVVLLREGQLAGAGASQPMLAAILVVVGIAAVAAGAFLVRRKGANQKP